MNIMKHFIYITAFIISLTFTSCIGYTYATTQDDIYVETEADIVHSNVDFNIVIRYGTPYYYEGNLLYYLYEGLYYYPFYYDNYWYVRAYRRPFAHLHHRPYFRPHRYDYRFRPDHHPGFGRHGYFNGRPHRPDVRPGNRPGNHHDIRPGNRPTHRPDVRPGNRPGNHQGVRPDNRSGNRPGYHQNTRPHSTGGAVRPQGRPGGSVPSHMPRAGAGHHSHRR